MAKQFVSDILIFCLLLIYMNGLRLKVIVWFLTCSWHARYLANAKQRGGILMSF